MRAADEDLWTAIALLNFHNKNADFFVRAVTFARNLLLPYQIRLSASQAKRDLSGINALHSASDQITFTIDEFVIESVSFRFTDLLQDHLFGGLSRNATEAFCRVFPPEP